MISLRAARHASMQTFVQAVWHVKQMCSLHAIDTGRNSHSSARWVTALGRKMLHAMSHVPDTKRPS
jgi:hypothetical protein